jgi:LCP family protein required for cell wall assembly
LTPDDADRTSERPEYNVYRSRPRLFGRRRELDDSRPGDQVRELRQDGPPGEPPPYTVHRTGGRTPRMPGLPRRRRLGGITPWRVLRWVLTAAVAWTLVSLLLFLVSAQLRQGDLSGQAGNALDGGGYPLTSPTNVLVLGSDARTKETAEPGSKIGGPSRSDSILLVRTGGGDSARLSIPRDTVVDIPGHGRDKINAAFAIGGPALAITTIKQYLGIPIHHVVEVDFGNFPALIDALGGIDVRTGCVVSRINGGFKNGGFTLRLRPGENHLDGKQALALARTRKNDCNKRENDLTRARRQQKIFSAMKSRVTSPITFARLPWVSWEAPKAIRSDMAGPNLIGLFGAIATGGTPKTRVMRPDGGEASPGGGMGLHVSDAEKQAEVRRFMAG